MLKRNMLNGATCRSYLRRRSYLLEENRRHRALSVFGLLVRSGRPQSTLTATSPTSATCPTSAAEAPRATSSLEPREFLAPLAPSLVALEPAALGVVGVLRRARYSRARVDPPAAAAVLLRLRSTWSSTSPKPCRAATRSPPMRCILQA